METRITFLSDGLRLEGLLDEAAAQGAVVVTHPHPLYGGDMHNPVVAAIAGAYRENGYTTLRFNFRGTGGSEGRHDQGVGERNDAAAAVDYLKAAGAETVEVAGYSFGAWVNAHLGCARAGIDRMVMVSPPIGFIDFGAVGRIECLQLVVTGSRDDIAPPDLIRNALPGWNPRARFEIIGGADHFYGGRLEELKEVLNRWGCKP
jgi:alpha/beta superfamily hydrolase